MDHTLIVQRIQEAGSPSSGVKHRYAVKDVTAMKTLAEGSRAAMLAARRLMEMSAARARPEPVRVVQTGRVTGLEKNHFRMDTPLVYAEGRCRVRLSTSGGDGWVNITRAQFDTLHAMLERAPGSPKVLVTIEIAP